MKIPRILLTIALLNTSISWAEIYKYTDENGQVTFTAVQKYGAKKIGLPKVSERKATPAETNKCFEQHRNTFLDPRSAYPVNAKYRVYKYPESPGKKNQVESEVVIDVSARNELGGFSRTMVSCHYK